MPNIFDRGLLYYTETVAFIINGPWMEWRIVLMAVMKVYEENFILKI